MEDLKQGLTNLTGAVNSLIDQMKSADKRIENLERKLTSSQQPIADAIDVSIEPPRVQLTEEDLKNICKLPDCVKELQVFDGNPAQYVSWIHSVEGILNDYEVVRNKPLYWAILKSIRGKIRGSADTALISYNIFDNKWSEIKKCLSLHYADKRDIRTLEHQLSRLTQGNSKIDEFYATVNHQFSLIINKIKTDSYSEETVEALIETYRNRALDVFTRGLNGDLSRMITVQKPKTLPEAYTACLDIQNLNYRKYPIHNSYGSNSVTVPINDITSRPSDSNSSHIRFKNHVQTGASPDLPPRRSENYQGPPPRANAFQPNENARLSRSVGSYKVNYMNRPNAFKRGAVSDRFPQKQQRLFNMNMREGPEVLPTEGEEEVQDQVNFMIGATPGYLT